MKSVFLGWQLMTHPSAPPMDWMPVFTMMTAGARSPRRILGYLFAKSTRLEAGPFRASSVCIWCLLSLASSSRKET
eukprot:1877135-Heterocapsa_arctica.AAC.1